MADAGVGDEPGELALGQDIAGQPDTVREEEGSEIEGWMSEEESEESVGLGGLGDGQRRVEV